MLHRSSSNTAITTRNLMVSIWIMLVLLVVTSLFIEHSMIDLSLARLAYQGDGQWLIDKQNTALFIIFYTAPKYLLIALEIYIIAAYLVRKLKRQFGVFYPCRHLSTHSLAYLSLALVSTPLVVGIAKAVTHVACPVSLDVFGWDLPYVSLIQSMILAYLPNAFLLLMPVSVLHCMPLLLCLNLVIIAKKLSSSPRCLGLSWAAIRC